MGKPLFYDPSNTITATPVLSWQTELLRQIERNRGDGRRGVTIVLVYDPHVQAWRLHHDGGPPTVISERNA